MKTIKEAIEEFRKKRLDVYRADPDDIRRNTLGAERAATDHVGRWLFELLQNSDDATASEVRILFEDNVVYVADNGRGLTPEAVSAICGTDLSNKTTGTIGRKGVGFKSVYTVSSNPQVLTVNGEGVEFSPEKAGEWLRENEFDDGHIPYQWIPFFISWDEALRLDPILGALGDYKTVVRLPGVSFDKRKKVERLLQEWPPHALFAFRHVRRIAAPHLEVDLTPGEEIWGLNDSRGETPKAWLVARHTEHNVPEELLARLGTDERKTIKSDGVSFLIAAPLADGCVTPTGEYLPIHVFYPTEENGPVRLLLHAEFLVKSDRTALISIDDSPFNAWVAESLASQVCQFVNGAFRQEKPSSHAALLRPFDDGASWQRDTKAIWQRIAQVAKAHLLLADIKGVQCLTVDEARIVSVTVRRDLARKLLEATDVRGQLLHCSFDEDEDAQKTLKAFGCEEINSRSLVKIIAQNAASQTADVQWVWACWEWLAAWVGKEPYGEKHKERVDRVKELPIVPIAGQLLRPSDLAGRIITWESGGHAEDLPDWLPLTFVDGWFRDRLQGISEEDSAVKKLHGELGIEEPGADVIQRAVGRAIEQYWKDRQGDPLRFLCFISGQDWYETSMSSPELQRCPVSLSQLQNKKYAAARKVYFGRDWGNDLLADLYDGFETVAWVENDGMEESEGKHRRVLKWLGVADCPRVVEVKRETSVWQLPADCDDWKRYLENKKNRRGAARIDIGINGIDHLVINELKHKRAVLLVHLLATHWESYYSKHNKCYGNLYGPKGGYYGSEEVNAKWWWEVCEKIALPVLGGFDKNIPITRCWLPDKKTMQDIGDLLPVIDLEVFGSAKDIVRNWLVSTVGLRTQICQVTLNEWKELLSKLIPALVPAEHAASNERRRDKATNWYEACLETVADQDNVPEKAFSDCPLLCRKGESWQYVAEGPRYLDDNNEFAKAFDGDVWLFHVPSRRTANAVKYFGVPSLSESVEVHVVRGEPQSLLGHELQAKFNDSLPYVWAWKSSKSKQDAERLSSRLKNLMVRIVPVLKAHLGLNGVCREVERHWDTSDEILSLHENHATETELSQALAEAVGAKSEADFYENLLRCNNGEQRKEKLLSKGISEAEVERCLREYSGLPEVEEPDKGEQTEQGEEVSTHMSPPTPSDEKQQPGGDHVLKPGLKTISPGDESKPVKEPLCLKDGRKVDYVVGGLHDPESSPQGSGGGGVAAGYEAYSLSQEEKSKVEEEGRRIATRELEKMGYMVEQMPTDHPGFDLRGRRGDEELRVEVKAHIGRASVADITQRQYKEYIGQQRYRWELWNVEHLAAQDGQQVVVTRYDDIPDDALDARTFRVDLKKCKSSASSL